MATQPELHFSITATNEDLKRKLAESRQAILDSGKTAEATASRIDGSFKRMALAAGAFLTAQQAISLGGDIIRVRGEIQMMEQSFEVLLQSKSKATKMIAEIKRLAIDSPLEMPQVSGAVQTLLGFGVEAEKVMGIVGQLSDVSMGNADRFRSLALVYAQCQSAGKLMGQDLLQMINAGFNPLQIISEQTGKSIAQLKEEMSKGAISADMVAAAFEKVTSVGGKFYQMTQKQADGIVGLQATLEDAITEQLNRYGEKNEEVIESGYKFATSVVENSDKIVSALIPLVAAYGTYKVAIIATEAVRKTISTIKHTEEAAALMKLLTVEQQAKISKLGLSKTSVEYATAVRAEVAANVQAAQATLTKARADVVAANQSVVARREEYVAAKQLERQRLAELMSIGATGSAKQVEAAQRKLSAVEMQRESSALAFQSATRDFNAKKIVVETAARTVNTTATAVNTAAQTANATATGFLSLVKTRLAAVTAKLNAVIMANPYAIAAVAIAALAYGIYKLVTHQTDAVKAQEKLNDVIKETNKNIDSEIHQIDSMFARLKSATKGTDEYRAAKEAIMSKHGEQLKKLGDEKNALNDIAAAYKLITEEVKKAARARAMESFTHEAADTLAEKEGNSKDEVRELLDKKYKGKKGSDGISLSETYYWKIKPVIEGEAEITHEIEKILKEFDRTKTSTSGNARAGNIKYTDYVVNDIKDQINKAAKARGIYNKVMSDAQMRFGENPSIDTGKKQAFDITTAALQQLMELLPKAKDELEALKSAEQPDPTLVAQKEQEIQQIKEQTAAREKSIITIKEVKAQIELLQKEQEQYGKDDTEYKALETRISNLKTKLPQTSTPKDIDSDIIDSMLRLEQMKISVMQQGRIKELAQIELTRKEKLAALDKEQKELAKKQGKPLSTEQAAGLNTERTLVGVEATKGAASINKKYDDEIADHWKALTAVFLSEEQKRTGAIKDRYDKERKWADEVFDKNMPGMMPLNMMFKMKIDAAEANEQLKPLLEQYQTYTDKRKEIETKFNTDIANLNKAGKTKQADKAVEQKDKALKKMDFEEAKNGIDLTKLFGNLDNMDLPSMNALKDKIKAWIDGAGDSLSPEDLKAVSDAFLKLEIKIADKDPFAVLKSSIADHKKAVEEVSTAQQVYNEALAKFGKDSNEAKKATEALATANSKKAASVAKANEAIGSVADKGKQIVGAAQDVIGIMSDLGVQVPEEIGNALGGIGQVMDGLGSIDLTSPLSIITGAVKVIGGLVKTIGSLFNGDGKRKQEIERLQGQIDSLQKSYDLLGKAIEKAYSTDASQLLEQSNELLEKRKQLIRLQIAEEESKKNSDGGQIESWKKQLEELDQEIKENKEKAIDVIFGADVKSAIDDFASAYMDAWSSGEDRAQAQKDVVKKMLRNIIQEMLKTDIGKQVKIMREKIAGFMSDKELDDSELAAIDSMGDEIGKIMEERGKMYDKILKDNSSTQNEQTLAGQIKGNMATEASVDELGGMLRGQNDSLVSIDNRLAIGFQNLVALAKTNAMIEANTRATAANTAQTVTTLASGFTAMQTELTAINKNTTKDTGSYGS